MCDCFQFSTPMGGGGGDGGEGGRRGEVNCVCVTASSSLPFGHAYFAPEFQGRPSLCCIILHPNNCMPASALDFNVSVDVDACDCTQGMHKHHKRVCTDSRFWEKNLCPKVTTLPTPSKTQETKGY